jgi:hypothetical protein
MWWGWMLVLLLGGGGLGAGAWAAVACAVPQSSTCLVSNWQRVTTAAASEGQPSSLAHGHHPTHVQSSCLRQRLALHKP